MDFQNPAVQAAVFGVAGVMAYAIGLWRRWRPGATGRPIFTESATRVREPWTVVAVFLLLIAAGLKFFARANA